MAGIGLGIYGEVSEPIANGDLVLTGGALHGDTWSRRAYLVKDANGPQISGSIQVTASDLDAQARLALAQLDIVNGSGVARTALDIFLLDPGTTSNSAGRITLPELVSGMSAISTVAQVQNFTSSLSLSLPVKAEVPWGNAIDTQSQPGIRVSWPSIQVAVPQLSLHPRSIASWMYVHWGQTTLCWLFRN